MAEAIFRDYKLHEIEFDLAETLTLILFLLEFQQKFNKQTRNSLIKLSKAFFA